MRTTVHVYTLGEISNFIDAGLCETSESYPGPSDSYMVLCKSNGEINVDTLVIVNERLRFWTVKEKATINGKSLGAVFSQMGIDCNSHIFSSDDNTPIDDDDLWLPSLIQFYAKDRSIVTMSGGLLTVADRNSNKVTKFQPDYEKISLNNGYIVDNAATTDIKDKMIVLNGELLPKPKWTYIRKGDVFEIPKGIKSLKVSIGANFVLSDDRSCKITYHEKLAEIFNLVFGNIKPWYNVSVEHYKRLRADNYFYIKLSTVERPELYKITKDIFLVPSVMYDVYKLVDETWTHELVVSLPTGRFGEEYYDSLVVVP